MRYTYILARHGVHRYVRGVWLVRGVVRGVRGGDERGVGGQPRGRVRRVVVVVQLRVVVERGHSVHSCSPAVHSRAFSTRSSCTDASRVHRAYRHRLQSQRVRLTFNEYALPRSMWGICTLA